MILVTGGTGLVGSHLLYDLLRSGKKVRALKRKESNLQNVEKVFSYYTSSPRHLFNQIEWVDADLLDVYSLLNVLDGVDYVYHCAAMVSFESRHQDEMMYLNVEGTTNLVNAALTKGIKKFCHVSSIATLGREEHDPIITENMFWKASPDHSNYALSKYEAEREVWRAAEEGLNVIIVNPSLIVGGGNWQQSSSNMFSKAFKGIRFYTDGVNGFVDVRDVSALMIKLMESDINKQRFILNSENSAFRRYFDLIHTAFGKPKSSIKAGKFLSGFAWRAEKVRHLLTGATPLITKETARSAHRVSHFSNNKILSVFPDYQFISLEEAVKHTAKLYLKDLSPSSIIDAAKVLA
ncbi:MAG TPA: NAD-dependent epimerase/dehydratase family protein [Bacteroidia bacterium]|jgi:nucleoside-diphosphate-sugar epimerase|nr:NAD-dependent epimerase/dehydratase family protein [Bacteroidia bacterium]